MTSPSIPDDGSGDSDDLQALFDSVAAATSAPAVPAPKPGPAASAGGDGDSDDLQALFDSVAASRPAAPIPAAEPPGDSDDLQALFDQVSASSARAPAATASTTDSAMEDAVQEAVFTRLGHLARQLHDSLRGLGMDRLLEDSARQIPDARERLTYIAKMTEQAASRVLNATDIAKPIQDSLLAQSQGLSTRWEKMFASQLSVDEFKQLAADTRGFFGSAPGQIKLSNEQLMEIVMAQDFQDLTGQVIKKVVELVQGLESQLLSVLLEAMPAERRAETPPGLLNGPVINGGGRADVVTNQGQVDELLESLGF